MAIDLEVGVFSLVVRVWCGAFLLDCEILSQSEGRNSAASETGEFYCPFRLHLHSRSASCSPAASPTCNGRFRLEKKYSADVVIFGHGHNFRDLAAQDSCSAWGPLGVVVDSVDPPHTSYHRSVAVSSFLSPFHHSTCHFFPPP